MILDALTDLHRWLQIASGVGFLLAVMTIPMASLRHSRPGYGRGLYGLTHLWGLTLWVWAALIIVLNLDTFPIWALIALSFLWVIGGASVVTIVAIVMLVLGAWQIALGLAGYVVAIYVVRFIAIGLMKPASAATSATTAAHRRTGHVQPSKDERCRSSPPAPEKCAALTWKDLPNSSPKDALQQMLPDSVDDGRGTEQPTAGTGQRGTPVAGGTAVVPSGRDTGLVDARDVQEAPRRICPGRSWRVRTVRPARRRCVAGVPDNSRRCSRRSDRAVVTPDRGTERVPHASA